MTLPGKSLPDRVCRCPGCRENDALRVSPTGSVQCVNGCSLEDVLEGLKWPPEHKRFMKTHPPTIGCDTEFVPGAGPRDNTNLLCSYQFFGILPGIQIPYFHNALRDGEISLVQMMSDFFVRALDERKLFQWPRVVHLVSHYGVADLPHFTDFPKFKDKLDAIQGTYVTVKDPLILRIPDGSKHWRQMEIWVYDTYLTAVGGKSLKAIGEALKYPKLDPGRSPKYGKRIERFNLWMEEDLPGATAYAMRDPEITAIWHLTFNALAGMNGQGRPFVTSGGAGVQELLKTFDEMGIDYREFFGRRVTSTKNYEKPVPKYKTEKNGDKIFNGYRPEVVRKEIPILNKVQMAAFEASVTGGRNMVSHYGPTSRGPWTEYDLSSAYVVAKCDIREPDWDNCRESDNLDDYTFETLGVAEVRFHAPVGSIAYDHPPIPIKCGDYGLIYVRTGKTWCFSPHIAVARELGMELEIITGYIVPWKSAQRPFFEFHMTKSAERKAAKANGEKLLVDVLKRKQLAIYGKTLQGSTGKTAFNPRAGKNLPIPDSQITCPPIGGYITAKVNACLGEFAALLDPKYSVVAETTDSIITNAPDLPTHGLAAQHFIKWATALHLDGVYGKKSVTERLLVTTNRSLMTVEEGADEQEEDNPVLITIEEGPKGASHKGSAVPTIKLQKGGVRVPDGDGRDEMKPADRERSENAWLLRKCLTRKAGDTYELNTSRTNREIHHQGGHRTPCTCNRRFSMEPDWKQRLVNFRPEMVAVRDDANIIHLAQHLVADTVPWDTEQDFLENRLVFQKWKAEGNGNVLRTTADLASWEEFRAGSEALRYGINRRGGVAGQAQRIILAVFANGAFGMTRREFAEGLTEAGYPTTVEQIENAKKRTNPRTPLPDHPDAEAVLSAAMVICPHFSLIPMEAPLALTA